VSAFPSYYSSSAETWLDGRFFFDLKKAEQDKKVMERVARIVPVKAVEEIRA
jgi:hypothetical protein